MFGMVGMAIAVLTTAALIVKLAGSPLGHRLGAAGPGGGRRRRRRDGASASR
jgi:hypothetical protein